MEDVHNIDIHPGIFQILVVFHRFGMWGDGDESSFRSRGRKCFIFTLFGFFVVSAFSVDFLNGDRNEAIFSLVVAITIFTSLFKLAYILWRKQEICEFLQDICVHSLTDHEEFTQISTKSNNFMKFAKYFIRMVALGFVLLMGLSLPIFVTEKKLPLTIGFPLNWRSSNVSYYTTYAFVVVNQVIAIITVLFSITMWYTMLNCSIKYETLGSQLRNMGVVRPTKFPVRMVLPVEAKATFATEKPDLFLQELIRLIKVHRHIKETINRFKTCFRNLFFTQIATSGICICCSVYVLAFTSHGNVFEDVVYVLLLLYSTFDIFMVMFYGNEIKLSSDRLSYCLFESNWTGQSKKARKCLLIFGEMLKRPHELVVGVLYPLNLETFISVIHFAYSAFNILKNFR